MIHDHIFLLTRYEGLARVFRVVPFFLVVLTLVGSSLLPTGLPFVYTLVLPSLGVPAPQLTRVQPLPLTWPSAFWICICILLGLRHLSPILFAFTFLAWCPGTTILPGAAAAIYLAVCYCISFTFQFTLVLRGTLFSGYWYFLWVCGTLDRLYNTVTLLLGGHLCILLLIFRIPGCGHCLNRTSRLLVTFPTSGLVFECANFNSF